MSTGAHILIEGLTHRYKAKGDVVLDDINVEIEPGQALAIIGRSGCGKSTLLHLIAGLMKPFEGKIWIDGLHVTDPSPKWIMMFQAPSLFPWMTVKDNVTLGLRFSGRMKMADAKAKELLELVHLEDFAETNVQDLSGGQQQRVALARSLATEPEALLLDEPFSALDAFTRATLQREVRAIAKKLGLTLIFVTHDIDEAAIMADRALIMSANPGRVRGDVTMNLPEIRDRNSAAVKTEKNRLLEIFEDTVGQAVGADSSDAEDLGDGDGETVVPARLGAA
ncbi:ABC transporter ATP-binding protein [Magnetospira sp. QH-2]|uniref:ABC transporter ATP-binding protein n=1 Tax=Magnetospira sp. (strain QH-2) TaxID=1288970 RepID=UPI0003E80D15|nr:ABC transporter ATP-binding protein [Magnetospira sp. QH-2]CCQ74957.1 Aliphatic sulfonates import ATP-binding protein ssuB [Magnetospira sp. QH-2]